DVTMNNTENEPIILGELIAEIYAEFMELYEDKELASVATASVISDMLSQPVDDQSLRRAA
ncbi:MAG: hypothetical protein ACI8S6_004585, partial [Myxococcota bacterium]